MGGREGGRWARRIFQNLGEVVLVLNRDKFSCKWGERSIHDMMIHCWNGQVFF